MTYREYNESQRKKWIGKKVMYDGAVYTVVDVDYNGALMIDKPAKFTDTTAVSISMIQVIEEEQVMSKDWTPEELLAASAAMKEAGEMGYEEFCAEIEEQEAKQKIEAFGKVQADGDHFCPRCGRMTVKDRKVTNALSRHATVYVCDACGTDEAIRDFTGAVLPLKDWAIAKLPLIPLGGQA